MTIWLWDIEGDIKKLKHGAYMLKWTKENPIMISWDYVKTLFRCFNLSMVFAAKQISYIFGYYPKLQAGQCFVADGILVLSLNFIGR